MTKTLVDLAGVVGQDGVELALEDALRRGLTSHARLRWQLARESHPAAKGPRSIERLLKLRGEGTRPTESHLETKCARVLRNSSLPPPIRQHRVFEGNRFVARPDFAYPEAKVCIEVLGFKFHSGRSAWYRDRARLEDLRRLSWQIVFFTQEDARDPRRFTAEVAGLVELALFV